MDFISGLLAFFLVIIGAAIWLAPIVLIALSTRTSGKEKIAWILAVIFISWFAWIFYLLLAPLQQTSRYSRQSRLRY